MTANSKINEAQMSGDIQIRMVQDPSISDAQFWHDREQRPDDPYVGMVGVAMNLKTVVGGFARYSGDEHQIMAAAKFKRLHELSQIGGARACDMEREPVDGGGTNPEATFEIGADARKQFVAMQAHLGKEMFKRFERVVIGGVGPTAYVRMITGLHKPNTAQVAKGKREVRRIANNLAVFWGLSTRPKPVGINRMPVDRSA
tara:strand:+ start:2846 stop:3448 length:603 start_codon:yes stop_codon:yes gene_type:complete